MSGLMHGGHFVFPNEITHECATSTVAGVTKRTYKAHVVPTHS